ncbi:hypothetical protein Tco_1073149 [Tanacetum coccineum]
MRRKRANDEAEANAPPKVLRKDHGALTAAKSVSDPDLLSYAKPQPYPEKDIAQSSRGMATEIPTEHVATMEVNVQLSVGNPKSGKSTSVSSLVWSPGVAMGSQLRLRFEQEVRLLKKASAKIARRDQRIQVKEEEIKKLDQEDKSLRATKTEVHVLRNQTKNLETLLEAEADMKKATEAKTAKLTKELESLRIRFSDLQAAFEEFKKYEDARVEQRCRVAEMDARLDALSIDFDEELYQAYADGGFAGFCDGFSGNGSPKEISEGLKYGIEHGKGPTITERCPQMELSWSSHTPLLHFEGDTGKMPLIGLSGTSA